MKQKFIYQLSFILILMLSVSSCLYEDIGNYNYKEINEATVQGIPTNEWIYKMANVDTLRLNPVVDFTQAGEESDYEYKWIALPRAPLSDAQKEYVIGTEKNLNYFINMPAGQYLCYYQILDKKSNLKWSTKFYLDLTSTTDRGWLVLCDINGKARLDIVVPLAANNLGTIEKCRIGRDVLANASIIGEPLKIFSQACDFKGASILTVTGKNGSYTINPTTFILEEAYNLRYEFGGLPPQVNVFAIMQTYTNGSNNDRLRILVDANGDYYTKNYYQDGAIYNFRQNLSPGTTSDYCKTAPYIGTRMERSNMLTDGTNPCIVLYDQTNKRFMQIVSGTTKSTVLAYNDGAPLWSSSTTGRDMVYMESTSNATNRATTFAILKDPATKQLWLYGIDLLKNSANRQMFYLNLSNIAPEINQATSFAFHSVYNYLFYAVGSKVYRLDYNQQPDAGQAEIVVDLSSTHETIVNLKFWLQFRSVLADFTLKSRWDLVVTSNKADAPDISDENRGVVRSYYVPATRIPLEPNFTYQNFGKIIDISYKEANLLW